MFSELSTLKDIKSRSICPENFTGEKAAAVGQKPAQEPAVPGSLA